MGHFGSSGFDTDEGADWLAALAARPSSRKISAALAKYRRHCLNPSTPVRSVTPEYIASVVRSLRQSWTNNPPRAYRKSGMTLAEWMDRRAAEIRDHYESGRYLDELYGPVEPALAAAELVSAWAGYPKRGELPGAVQDVLRGLGSSRPSAGLIGAAADVVDQILSNEKYERMRRLHLEAFPQFSGGFDSMEGIRDLRSRLRTAQSGV